VPSRNANRIHRAFIKFSIGRWGCISYVSSQPALLQDWLIAVGVCTKSKKMTVNPGAG
jgi:hypothetical protein